MIKIVDGDLLQAKEDIIGQQVNCRGVMGSGLARSIRSRYPNIYKQYMKTCDWTEGQEELLGLCQFATDGDVIVVNLFAQLNYGRDKDVVYTDYDALKECLTYLKTIAKNCEYSVALPYNIGCGLANGDWNVVYKIIDEAFDDYEVTLYRI